MHSLRPIIKLSKKTQPSNSKDGRREEKEPTTFIIRILRKSLIERMVFKDSLIQCILRLHCNINSA